jgi:mRNA interferase RelE/StbE
VSYEVHTIRSAEKELDRLPTAVHARLSKRILALEDNPRPRGIKKLSGREEYRLRVGDYRILYIIDDKKHIITIFAVGHRREVYG